MTTLAERLKKARKHAKLSQTAVAEKINISQPSYSALERGESRTTSKIIELANLFDVNAEWLDSGKGEMLDTPANRMEFTPPIWFDAFADRLKQIKQENVVSIASVLNTYKPTPVISWVQAGSWSEVEPAMLENAMDFLPRPIGLSDFGFALKVVGESMLPEFRPDDYIYVEPNVTPFELKNRDLVVVQQDNKATFKQLVIGETPEDMYLKPLNPNWHEQKMTPMGEWVLVGKVVGKYVKY